ncbi:MAG: hypothetical protein HUU20_13185 [Pirellulales bacterium]|nr:hypothetical protein [Pirellulales bacterium]
MFKPFAIVPLACLAALLAGAGPAAAQEKAEEKITFEDHIRPIFREHCFTCHSQSKAQNDLALDSYERVIAGGASGEVVTAGDPDGSYLWNLVSHKEQPAMPPNQGKIADAKLELIRKWIAGGALKDKGSTAQVKKKAGLEMTVPAGAGKPEGEPAMPAGLTRQPPVYSARPGAVTAIAASPWAPLAAIAGQQQIVLYHTNTAELLGILPYPEGTAFSLRFNRSGSLLLAGGGRGASLGIVAVYDVKTGKRAFQVGDELDVVLAADMNAANTLVALGGPQKIVRVYSTADGSLVTEIKKHTDWIYAVEFSPDGVLLATADRSGGLWVWEAGTDREFYNLDGHKAPVTGISWRADSNVLASASEDGTIKYWNMIDGKAIRSINAHGGGVAAVHFIHDGRLASIGRDRVVKLWDGEGKQVRAFDAFSELGLEVALTHDGGRVIAGDWTGEIRMYHTADGKLVARLASNPPTLEMVLQAAQAKAAEAQAAADKAAAESAAAEKAAADKQKSADETAATAAQKAAEAKTAAEKLEAAKAALAKAAGEKPAADKALADAEAKSKQATADAAAAKTAADQGVSTAAQKAEAAKAAAEKAAAAKAAAESATENKEAAQKAAAEAESGAKQAADEAAGAKAKADELAAAAAQKAQVSQAAAQQMEAARTALGALVQAIAANEKAVAEATTASQQAAQAAAAAKTAADQRAAEVEPLKKASLEKTLAAQLAAKAADDAKKAADQAAAEKTVYDQKEKPQG